MNPTLVINAYKRPLSLERLLESLTKAFIPENVNLVFSVEGGADPRVVDVIEKYTWNYGKKIILKHEEKLGLINHFMFCGGLTQRFGTIVYLEDDLFIGPSFYLYVQQVLDQYEQEETIAGFSLNSLWFNGYTHLPFEPLVDGNPCFFLQVPWYQGQIYTRSQWARFEKWLSEKKVVTQTLHIHDLFRNYTLKDDWFPIKTQYLIETSHYYCFPRVSHCVNFGDQGTHFQKKTNFFQTTLALKVQNSNWLSFADCLAVYDSYYELEINRFKKMVPHLSDFDLTVDLNGTKNLSSLSTSFVLSPRASAHAIDNYGLEMKPQELNIVYEIAGTFFTLCETKSLSNAKNSGKLNLRRFFYHHRFRLGKKNTVRLLIDLIKSLFRN